jgi:hypothetical protein
LSVWALSRIRACAASDGLVGHVDDFLFDAGSWTIGRLVINTSNLAGRSVLLNPEGVRTSDRDTLTLHVDLTPEALLRSAEFRAAEMISRSGSTREFDGARAG